MKKIKIEKSLYEKAEEFSRKKGYSSVSEFITHLIEKELSSFDKGNDSLQEVEDRLKGLGYIS
jgi:metal-responsive CopG/Arc/MetJ family transcriptional regulator